VDIIFIDLAKAFDKIPHLRLLEKLKSMALIENFKTVELLVTG